METTAIIRALVLLTTLVLLAIACVEDVEYELTCETVKCPNADETSSFTSGNNRSFTCIWLCADYAGNERVYVALDFWSWNGGCWELESEYIADGICN